MKKLLSLLALFNFVCALNFSLDQPSIHLETSRGSTVTSKIRLTNRGAEALNLRVYVRDWRYADGGAKEFLPAGESEYSCADWLKLSADTLAIPAGGSKDFYFDLRTPADAEGGHQAVIFFETLAGPAAGQVSYGARLGAIVYQKTKRHTLEAVEPLVLRAGLEKETVAYELVFANRGNAWNSVRGVLALVEDGIALEEIELPLKGLLPGEPAEYTGSFTRGAGLDRLEILYALEDAAGAVQTGQLLTADSAEAVAKTRLWVERFEPVFSPERRSLDIFCALQASNILRVSPVVKIYNVETKKQVKTVEFNAKLLRPYETGAMTVSWPIDAAVIGALPPGEYNCVLNIKNGQETISEQKIIRIN
ncbi:MAG: hypothetical protein LBD99_05180 [Candidatus Margulisbacteria bacterium]|nr:hypothetical protein [Candidatus Margulisiibacteriota bacterium]